MSAIGRTISGPAILHPSQVAKKGMPWSDFSDIIVRRALTVGMSLQLHQQVNSFFLLHKRDFFGPYNMLLVMYDVCLSEDIVSVQLCSISAVLNFTPQILKQSGVDTLLVQAGIKANSCFSIGKCCYLSTNVSLYSACNVSNGPCWKEVLLILMYI